MFIVAILSSLTGFAQGGYDPVNPGDPNPYRKLTISASPKAGGSVYTDNDSQVGVGQTVSCRAGENRYYVFVHWLQNGEIVSTESRYSFVMPDENVEMVAVFELNYNPQSPDDPQETKPSHRVTLTASPGKGGYFNNSVFKLCEGDSINIYAYPNEGYRFEEWLLDDVLVSTKNPLMVKMTDKNLRYTARFSYNPINPADPAANLFNPGTGEMVVDKFEQGYLSSAISRLLNDDYDYSDIQSLLVCGIMDGSDFGAMSQLSNCLTIDLSRTNGYVEIPSYAFESMTSLTDISLSSCVNSIGRYAFLNCENLSVIACYATMPPFLSYGALDGVDKSVVIKVPAQSVDLYKNAQGWKDQTILPADTDVHSISVSLPSDAKDGRYKNMSIELLNTLSGQRYKYLIADKTEYVFGNLLSSTRYSISVKNSKNEVLGEISDLEIIDKDLTVVFESLRHPKNVAVKVVTPDDNDVTSEVVIKWYNGDNELLQVGSTLTGVLENSVVSYTVTLPHQLQKAYLQPSPQTITVSDQKALICTLEKLDKSILKGKVCDTEGRVITSAIITVSQNINGAYYNSEIAQCDSNGTYELEVLDVPLEVTVSANGYVGQTKVLQSSSMGIGDIVLERNTGIAIYPSCSFQQSVSTGQETQSSNLFSDDSNIAYRVEDLSGNEIPNCTYLYGSIILPDNISLGDEVNVVAYSKTDKFKEVFQTVNVNSKNIYVSLPIVEYGGICITLNDDDVATNICVLYDEAGNQISKSTFRNNSVSFGNLHDGQYTLISMQKSSLLGSVSNLSSLQETQLVQGIDYLLDKVSVISGRISDVAITDIPELDETKLYYTDSKGTYFMPNKSQLTIGNYVTLKAKMTIKDEYSDVIDAATLVVDIPSNCEFVYNSVISGSGYLGYEYANNRLVIPIQNLNDAVRFCMVPLEGGDCKPSAFIKLIVNNEEIQQPIGSGYFEAKNFSLTVPKKTSKTNIAIRGTATPDSKVLIYDNETLVGSTYSMPNGQWSVSLSLHKPYSKSIHNLYGEVIAKDGKRLLTQTKVVDYDQSYVDLSKVTMVYNNTNIIFDHLNGKNTANSYSYVPSATDFTFIADFTENNPDKISNVIIKVLASDGSVRFLPAEFNPASSSWIACTKYADSNKLPVNVTSEFELLCSETSTYSEERQRDDDALFEAVSAEVVAAYGNGEFHKMIDEESSQLIAVLPENQEEWEHIGLDLLDYNQLKSELEGYSTLTYDGKDENVTFLDSLSSDGFYTLYLLDNNKREAFALKYYGVNSVNRLGPRKTLPFLIGGIVGGLISSTVERRLSDNSIEFWETQYTFDKERFQNNNVALVNALYAECPDGSLSIKPDFGFVESKVDAWGEELVYFLRTYKKAIDLMAIWYNQKWWAQNLLNVGLGLFFEGFNLPGGWISESYTTQLSIQFGELLNEQCQDPTEALSRWYDRESRKLVRDYIETMDFIKSQYDCTEEEEDDNDDGDFPAPPITPSIDPSGYVYEAVPSNRIPGVTATAYYKQQEEDMYGDITETAVVWDATPFGQENPLTTDAQGKYAWDVPAGMWQVRFEKEGYVSAQSAWLPVPPPQLDVNIAMTQAKQPEVKTVHAYSDGVTIEFNKFMLPSSLAIGNISITQNGSLVNGTIEASDMELDVNGNAFCSKIEFKPNEPIADGEATLFVSKAVKSYANINMSEDFVQTFAIEPRVSEIKVKRNLKINSGSTVKLFASVLPVTAAEGKVVTVESLNPLIASVSVEKVKADANGNFFFDVFGLVLGSTSIKLAIEDYDIEAIVDVDVLSPQDENQVAIPYASMESGEIAAGTKVYLYCETENASIYYTTDGSCPCDANRHKYDGTPIVVSKNLTLKIMAEVDGMIESDVAEYQYTVSGTGFGEIQIGKDLSIYPLPLGEYINISNGGVAIDAVSILSLDGKLMLHSDNPEKQVSLKTGFLAPGVYLLQIKTNGQFVVRKVIKR